MAVGNRETKIKQIIEMEDRICECKRCSELIRCVRKPSLGKGDLEPNLIMIFEYENDFTSEMNKIIELRNIIKSQTKIERIYHTFMVRCCPKSCANLHNTTCYVQNKLLDKEYNCILSGLKCDGIPIRPSNEEIISCLPFLLEEIETLNPDGIILFGRRVGDFVLKSYGIFDNPEPGNKYQINDRTLFLTVEESLFNALECKKLTST